MAFPPVPESPIRQLPSRSSGTPREGMHLYSNDEDDDVSVLTFHTMGTKESSVGSNSSLVKSARENLERMIAENKNSGEDDGKSLTRISEEGGSQNSSYNSKSRSSQNSSYNSKSRSSKLSSVRSDEKEKINKDNYDNDDDDDTISLAESILDSANKVLSRIGSSSYYAGRSKKPSSPTYESPLPQPNRKQPSPMKQPTKTNDTDDTGKFSKNIYSTKKEFTSSKKISNDHDNQLDVSSNFLRSYFSDENIKPSTNRPNHNETGSINTYGCFYEGSKTINNDQNLQKLESETKHLQLLLKERQLETKKASQSLGSSIKKANALLERLSADRIA